MDLGIVKAKQMEFGNGLSVKGNGRGVSNSEIRLPLPFPKEMKPEFNE